jgi:Glycosyl hydrolase family 10
MDVKNFPQRIKLADSLAPNSVLYLNDYVAIEQGDLPNNGIATWRSRIDELIAAGAPIEGIGFQGHFSASPTGIPRVKEIYDEFWNVYGLEAKITEYDIDKLVPAQTQADYMRDILTITFAHPSMKGFLMWGFWDGAHWLANSPLYREDWTLKPSGEAFIDQVFNQWWTNETLQTNLSGNASVRGFKGKYKVTVDCGDGLSQTRFIDLFSDTILIFNALCLVHTDEAQQVLPFTATPTLVRDAVVLKWGSAGFSGSITLRATDAMGRLVAEQVLDQRAASHTFQTTAWPSGTYFLSIENGGRRQVLRVVVSGF